MAFFKFVSQVSTMAFFDGIHKLGLRIRRYAYPFDRKKGQKGKTLRDHRAEFEKSKRKREKEEYQQMEFERAMEFEKSFSPKPNLKEPTKSKDATGSNASDSGKN